MDKGDVVIFTDRGSGRRIGLVLRTVADLVEIQPAGRKCRVLIHASRIIDKVPSDRPPP